MSERITIEDALRDFRKSGLSPEPCVTVRVEQDGERRGCLLGAMYVARSGASEAKSTNVVQAELFLQGCGFSEYYLIGLRNGFDNNPDDPSWRVHVQKMLSDPYLQEYVEGRLTGAEVRARMDLQSSAEAQELEEAQA